jgi:hypothetical protein
MLILRTCVTVCVPAVVAQAALYLAVTISNYNVDVRSSVNAKFQILQLRHPAIRLYESTSKA